MIKKYINLIFCAAALGGMTSCNDVLDINDESTFSDMVVWSSPETADMYITASYKTFFDYANMAQEQDNRCKFYDSYSDLTKSSSWDQFNHPFNKALLQPSAFNETGAGAFECWSSSYTRIRRANICLRDLEIYGVPRYGEDWAAPRRAEIRLCRAYAYFCLARVYGGVILRTDKSGASGSVDDGIYPEDIAKPRASEAETYKFILDELQAAAEDLPDKLSGTWLRGRATKAMAYGLISRIALYAKEWQIAADAAEKCGKCDGVGLASSYAGLFSVNSDFEAENNKEFIFALYFQKGSKFHYFDLRHRPYGDGVLNKASTYAEHQPTAELADMYEFADGTPFDWETYSSAHANPYTDREPRFHATILYNGAKWEERFIETFAGGSDEFSEFRQSKSTEGHTCTGYYLRKFLMEGHKDFINERSWMPDPVLRYAEVLLNKAEAYAELDYIGNQTKALGALNEVRERVGLPGKTPADAPDYEAFMEILRHERCVELAAEGFRYWDLRRWRLAEKVINGQNAHGVKVKNLGNGRYSYERVEVDGGTPRIFLEKYYYFSIPTSERANNPACKNNPMW